MAPTVSRILVFGATGQGKSSLINVLRDTWEAPVSDGAKGATFETTPYPFLTNECKYTFVDTVGLGEAGDNAQVSGAIAIRNLYKLLRDSSQEGFNLAVMVHKDDRLTTAAFRNNYQLFVDIICKDSGDLPVILVKLGLERKWDPREWLKEESNAAILDADYPNFKSRIVCGCAATAHDFPVLEVAYSKARKQTHVDVWKAIQAYQLDKPLQRVVGYSFSRVWNRAWSLLGKLDFSKGQGWNNLVLKATWLSQPGKEAYDVLIKMGLAPWEAKEIAVELTR